MKRINSNQIGEFWIFKRSQNGSWYYAITKDGIKIERSLKTNHFGKATEIVKSLSVEAISANDDIDLPETIDESIKEYFNYLESEGRRKGTVKRYLPIFERFKLFCNQKKITKFNQLNQRLLDSYRSFRNDGSSDSTRYLESKCLVAYGKYLARHKITKEIPFSLFGIKKPKAIQSKWFTQIDLNNIIQLAKDNDKSLFEFLAFTGLRISEACRLNWEDIDLRKGFVHVRSTSENPTKNSNARMIPMHDRVRNILMNMKVKSGLVFHSGKSKKYPNADGPLCDRRVLTRIKKICLKLGIEGDTHTFRRFFCSYFANAGVPPTTLMKWSGHSDLKVLIDHYYKLENSDSLDAMKKISEKDKAKVEGGELLETR
jgi:integrase